MNVEDPDYFGKKGFRRVKFIHETRTIDLERLSAATGASPKKGEGAEKKSKINVVDLGYEKVLGRGRIDKPVIVEALSFSKIAKQKIESAGGKTVVVQH
jgi:large subunit ribosomal protein L15